LELNATVSGVGTQCNNHPDAKQQPKKTTTTTTTTTQNTRFSNICDTQDGNSEIMDGRMPFATVDGVLDD
jgi:hypothetical protein